MFRTLIVGILLGLVAVGGITYSYPVVDLHRERSIISVQPNGGNTEAFRINLPRDRIMVGLSGVEDSIPAELEWPDRDFLGQFQAELFKVRDRNNAVVGLASRLASASEATGSFIEWAVHLPARGTIYATMNVTPDDDGFRNGVLRSGTREFAELTGAVREQFVADVDDDSEVQGRIELVTRLVGPQSDEEGTP